MRVATFVHNAFKIPRMVQGARTRFDSVYEQIAELVARHTDDPPGLTRFEFRVFSQNGEDGVIAEIFRRVGVTNRYFVEFGICEGVQGNAVFLADVMGWSGTFIEADPRLYKHLVRKYRHLDPVKTVQAIVAADNVETIFGDAGVPTEFDLLVIDIDGNDYWVWRSIERFRPRVVIIEFNGFLPLDKPVVQPYVLDNAWDGSDFYGASLGAMESLGKEKGYRLVHTDLTGTNAFFVRGDLSDGFDSPARHVANQHLLGTVHRHKSDRVYVNLDIDGPS